MEARGECGGVRRNARFFWAAVGGSAVFLAVFVAWIRFRLGGPSVSHIFDDVAGAVVPLAAAAACFVSAADTTGRSRRAWRMIAGATLSWGLGEVAWTFYELALRREVPFPSIADIGYLLFIPLAIVGLLTIPSAPERVVGRIRTLLDGLLIATALLFVSWALVLGPMYADASQPLLAKAIGLVYPIGDVAIGSVALTLMIRAQRGGRSPLMLLSTGLLTLAVADSFFAYLTLRGSYQTGDSLDALWVAAFLLVGLAGVRRRTGVRAKSRTERPPSIMRTLLPYAPLAPAVALGGARAASPRPFGPFLLWDGLALILLLLGRQFFTLTENIRLNHNLEATVRARTKDLAASERAARDVLETANDAFVSLDAAALIVDWNSRAEAMFGWSRDEALGRTPQETMAPDLPELYVPRAVQKLEQTLAEQGSGRRFEATARHRLGRSFPVDVTAWVSEAPEGPRLNVFVRDVSEQKELEAQLKHQALHDALTALPNRVLFEDRVAQALARGSRSDRRLALMFLDLDDFGTINDSLGHEAGDRVLIETAGRLRGALRPSDTVARFAGDQFAILVEDETEDAVRSTVTRLIEVLAAPLIVQEKEIAIRSSVGIAWATEVQGSRDLLRNAEAALHDAKRNAKGSFRMYEPGMHLRVADRLDLEADLRRAIDREQIDVAYQPIVDLTTGRLAGVEALARWRHPTRGNVPPSAFIPVAEATGLIIPLGRRILERACAEASSWNARYPGHPVKVNVNMSAKQIAGHDPAVLVRSVLERTRLPAELLTIEITESIFVEDGADLEEMIHLLRRTGAHIAIDDFGTGYSSLGYLRRLPVDVVKIDKSFVDGIPEREGDVGIVRGLVRIASTLGMDVTAEGIERLDQAQALAALGCRYGQGFLFARAVPPASIAHLIERDEPLYVPAAPLRAVAASGVA